jgi:hypothetical protein
MSPVNVKLTDLIKQLDDDKPEVDPLAKISEAQLRSHTLADLGDQLVGHYVALARAAGASWQQIGEAIGVSKQAAQQRWVNPPKPTFERFTKRARHVVVLSQEHARSHKHNYIGTEHVLLGLLDEPEGLAAIALAKLVGSVETVRAAVLDRLGPEGDKAVKGHIPFTPRAKEALELSMQAALRFGHNYIGTEHILLGLVDEAEGLAATVLGELGVRKAAAEEQVKQELGNVLARKADAEQAETDEQ